MSKSGELYNIRRRNISSDQERGKDGYNLYSIISVSNSTAFAVRLEEESELAVRLRYCRAFMYGLKKILPAGEHEKLCESMITQDGAAQGISPAMAARILAHRPQFERIKTLFPWEGAAVFERRFFQRLTAVNRRYKNKLRQCKNYYENNFEAVAARNKSYYEKNFKTIAAKRKKQRAANRGKISEYRHRYYERNKEKSKEYARKYYQENKEKVLTQQRAYRQANPEKAQEYYAKNCERIKARCRENYAKHKNLQSEDKAKCQNQANSVTYCAEP